MPANRSVVGVQLQELLPQLWSDMLEAGEIEFTNLALIGVAEPVVLRGSIGSQVALREDIFKVTDAQLRSLQRFQKLRHMPRRKRGIDCVLHRAKSLRIGDGKYGLLIQTAQDTLLRTGYWIASKSLERETGIGPATNSLEGCDSTTELLPHYPPQGRQHQPSASCDHF